MPWYLGLAKLYVKPIAVACQARGAETTQYWASTASTEVSDTPKIIRRPSRKSFTPASAGQNHGGRRLEVAGQDS